MTDRRSRILAILAYLERNILQDQEIVTGTEIADAGYSIPQVFPSESVEWRSFAQDETWGGRDKHNLFRCTVPGRPGRMLALILHTDSKVRWSTDNPQVLVYLNGALRGTMDVNHQMIVLSRCCGECEIFSLGFYAYSNSRDRSSFFRLSTGVLSAAVFSLYYDMKNVFEAADLLPPDDISRIRAFSVLEKAIDVLDTRSAELLERSAPDAGAVLQSYMEQQDPSPVTVWSVGSTHIDVAWKWPLRQTRQKAVRSALTALNLMEHYPDYRFLFTQPQLYEFIREERPDVFERIRERIGEGRWEAEGGMWLESDCNLAGGESLVRQLLHGKRYITETLGAPESEILWLPDAFGFNGNLPQIMRKAGIRYFMTTKISWSDTHIFPYDIFSWQGIDGSEVLSYFISTREYGSDGRHPDYHTTYNGLQNASQIMGTWHRFQDKDITEHVLTCFGYGDGGGGPTFEMLENTKRLAHSIASCPRTELCSARDFFHSLEGRLRKKLPRWSGELYFEYHRGVMTSIAEEKKWNRRIECLTHDAEALSTIAGTDASELGNVWKTILLNQFHDILPGSAIDEVYDEAFREYEEAEAKDKAVIGRALASIAPAGKRLLAFNTSGLKRTSLLELDAEAEGYDGQLTYDGRYLYLASDIPSYGAGNVVSCHDDKPVISGDSDSFETPFFQIKIDQNNNLSSVFDKKQQREVIVPGVSGNRIISYEDRPLRFDNWNTEEYYREKAYPWEPDGGPEIVENGPLRAVVRVSFRSLQSRLVQHIAFYRHTARIDFISSLDWDGDHLLVKAEFPVDVHSYSADYEIQFGAITRSAVMNTDWDRAAFEVPALRWSDISEPGYGVSLLTDSRYGYSVKEGVMTVSLLKSGTDPAERADRGHHEFTYSLYPHAGTWREGGTVREAENLTKPFYSLFAAEEDIPSFVSCSQDDIVIDTIKRQEDGSGIVLRLYEAHGMRSEAEIIFGGSYHIFETDLLERNPVYIGDGCSIKRTFRPFEIVTLLIQ